MSSPLFCTPKRITATGNVGQGNLAGIFVAQASATPTITVYNSATTTTTDIVVNTFTPIAGTWYPMPFTCRDGIYVVISGTVDCTVSIA